MNEEYKIKGWVARDEDNALFFHTSQPCRDRESFLTLTNEKIGVWYCGNEFFSLSSFDKMFPQLSWEDEPIEVELTIKKI